MNELHCRHFLLCHSVWYNATDPDAGHTLTRVVAYIRPSGGGYPVYHPTLYAYVQLAGDVVDVTLRVDLVEVIEGEDREVGIRAFGPWDVAVTGLDPVESFFLPLTDVPIPAPGRYEFRLWAEGVDDPLAVELIEARR